MGVNIGKTLGNSFHWNFDYHFGNIFKEITVLLALENPCNGKTIKNWAQRLNFNLTDKCR